MEFSTGFKILIAALLVVVVVFEINRAIRDARLKKHMVALKEAMTQERQRWILRYHIFAKIMDNYGLTDHELRCAYFDIDELEMYKYKRNPALRMYIKEGYNDRGVKL